LFNTKIGCCIGLHNQRYFIAALTYGIVALTYGLYYHWHYVCAIIDTNYLTLPLIMLAPHFYLIFGYITPWQMAVAMLHCMAVSAWVLVTYVLFTQMQVTFTGLTQYERKHKLTTYNISLVENIKMTLGER